METNFIERNLEKKIHDKKFLRTNDLQNFTATSISLVQENKGLFILFVVFLVSIGLMIPGLKWYRLKQVDEFNTKFYQAQKSLKKEEAYRLLIDEYKSLPAVQLTRLKLVDELVEHKEVDQAMKVIESGLAGDERNIFSTLLILKAMDLLKQQGKITEAAQFATGRENRIIESFVPQFKMILADLFLISNKKEEARKIYQDLSTFGGFSSDKQTIAGSFDANMASEAKEKLLLIDLGVL